MLLVGGRGGGGRGGGGGGECMERQGEVFGFQKVRICGITIEIEIDTIYAIVWRNE